VTLILSFGYPFRTLSVGEKIEERERTARPGETQQQ
jgi:hypothetical protein